MTPTTSRTKLSIASLIVVVMLVQTLGCASQFEQDTQDIRVEVWTDDALVNPTACHIFTDSKNMQWVDVSKPLQVKRSDIPLWISCRSDTLGLAKGLLLPRLDESRGGQAHYRDGSGGLVDYGRRPSAFAYPSWVKLRLGQSSVFDRAKDVNCQSITRLDQH
jgi:hypothetical protein